MKKIEVVAAIIHKEKKHLATQRGSGEFKGLWEFPGGKIESGESHTTALKREIGEELNLQIEVERFVCTTRFDYPSFHLTMHCYLCSCVAGEIELREHLSYRWLSPEALNDVEWLPADEEVVRVLQNYSTHIVQ